MSWSEHRIAGALARQTFERKNLVLVPNCNWTGNECDLLVVTRDLRIIDVEIKISRADLKADARKDKWWIHHGWRFGTKGNAPPKPTPRDWPPRVWKHYYCLPKEIWEDGLAQFLPTPKSGVLLIEDYKDAGYVVRCHRRAYPNKDAKKIDAEAAIDLARLASLRMWDTYDAMDRMARDHADIRRLETHHG